MCAKKEWENGVSVMNIKVNGFKSGWWGRTVTIEMRGFGRRSV